MSRQQQLGAAPLPQGGGPSPQQTVIIENLKSNIDEVALKGLCRKMGKVVSFRLHKLGPDADSLAAAIVSYACPEEAAHVVARVVGRLIAGQPVTARVASSGSSYCPPPSAASLPAASEAPVAQPPDSKMSPSAGGKSRDPYAGGAPERDSVSNGAPYKGRDSPTFCRYQHDQQPLIDEVVHKPRAGTVGNAPEWDNNRERDVPPSRSTTERPAGTGRYSDAYSHQDHRPSWADGRGPPPAVRSDHLNGTSGASARYHDTYVPHTMEAREREPWQEISRSPRDDWEKEESEKWPPYPEDQSRYGRSRAQGGAEPRSAYDPPPVSSLSLWEGETDQPSPRRYEGGVLPPPAHRMVHPVGRGPHPLEPTHDIRTHAEELYDETRGGLVVIERPRLPPPVSHPGITPAGHAAAVWNEQAGYSPLPLAVPSKDEFEKEVMRQAAKLVAERELAAREEARHNEEQVRQQQIEQPKRKQREDWKKGTTPTSADRRRPPPPPPQDVGSRERERERRDRERLPTGSAPGGVTAEHRDRRQRTRSTEDGDRAALKNKRDVTHNSREHDRRHHQKHEQHHHIQQRDYRVNSRGRGAEGTSDRLKRTGGVDVDHDGRRDGSKRARRDPSPAGQKSFPIDGIADDKNKNFSSASTHPRRDSRGRPMAQHLDRGHPVRDDLRARPREESRVERPPPRPLDDLRRRERQRHDERAAPRAAHDDRDRGRNDTRMREEPRGSGARSPAKTRQYEDNTSRLSERKRPDDDRKGRERNRGEDQRRRDEDRVRLRDNRNMNSRTAGTVNTRIDIDTAQLVNGAPRGAVSGPLSRPPPTIARPLQMINRYPPEPGQNPHEVGRHAQEFGGRPLDGGRLHMDGGRHVQVQGDHGRLKIRPAEERTVAERIAAERIANRVSDRVADRLRTREVTKSNNNVYQHESSTADTGWFVHVGGLSFSTTLTDLAKRFAAFGNVNGFKIIFNHIRTQNAAVGKGMDEKATVVASTGFAFISFDDEEGMLRAIEGMNGQTVDDNVLKVSRGRGQGKIVQQQGKSVQQQSPEQVPAQNLHRALKAPRRNPQGQQPNVKQEPNSSGTTASTIKSSADAAKHPLSKATPPSGASSAYTMSKAKSTASKSTSIVVAEISAAAASVVAAAASEAASRKASSPTSTAQKDSSRSGCGGQSTATTVTMVSVDNNANGTGTRGRRSQANQKGSVFDQFAGTPGNVPVLSTEVESSHKNGNGTVAANIAETPSDRPVSSIENKDTGLRQHNAGNSDAVKSCVKNTGDAPDRSGGGARVGIANIKVEIPSNGAGKVEMKSTASPAEKGGSVAKSG